MDSISTFGTYLREKRQQNNLSLRELAKKVGLSHIYLYNIECGKKAPPNDLAIIKLGKALKLDRRSLYLFFDMAAYSKAELDSDNYYLPIDMIQYLQEHSCLKDIIRRYGQQDELDSLWNELQNKLTK